MAKRKPDAWVCGYTGVLNYADGNVVACENCSPLYRLSPTHKEEQAVVRAAVFWVHEIAPDSDEDDDDWQKLKKAVDRLLAARKAKR